MAAANAPSVLLLVADDPAWRASLQEALLQEGFQVIQLPFSQSLPAAGRPAVQLLILNAPGAGVDPEASVALIENLRRRDAATPLLLVPDAASEDQRVALLEAGADDVLVRPFGLREFVARCRALLRRVKRRQPPASQARSGEVLAVGPIRLYRQECRVTRDGEEVNLSPREFRLLECFMLHPGRALSREQLLEQVWGADYSGDSKSVDVHVLWLRRKLDVQGPKPQLFITVRGIGYRLDPPRS